VKFSRVVGTGSYLPEQVMENAALEKMVDTTDEWIRERTGIERRHIAEKSETTCDLAEKAARNAMDMAGVTGNDIDLLIVATTTADCVFPSVACLLQNRLKITNATPAFDVQAVCAGFVYALGIADSFIKAGNAKSVLVIGAETFSRILNWEDRNTCVLFGDGAGAVVLQASDEPGIHCSRMHSDGRYAELLHVPEGVSRGYSEMQQQAYVQMRGRLSMSMDKVVVTVQDHGNTSAASIPLALDVAVRDGRIKTGEKLLLEGFGGGFTWGAALLTF